MTASWKPHFIMHSVIFYVSLISLMTHRYFMGDQNNIPFGISIAFAAFSMLDTACYTNIRAKAQLFIKLKVI